MTTYLWHKEAAQNMPKSFRRHCLPVMSRPRSTNHNRVTSFHAISVEPESTRPAVSNRPNPQHHCRHRQAVAETHLQSTFSITGKPAIVSVVEYVTAHVRMFFGNSRVNTMSVEE